MSRNEFLFHNVAVAVEDLTETHKRESQYLEHLILINAGERTLVKQERRVQRLANLINRTPSEGLNRFVRDIVKA
jgi:hypothetical protein